MQRSSSSRYAGAPVVCVMMACVGGAVSPALAGVVEPFLERGIARGINYPITLGAFQFGSGLGMFDMDQDGDPDVLLIGATDGRVGLYENDGTGHFTDRTYTAGTTTRLAKHTNYSGVSAADYDGDGDLDIYLSRYGAPNVFYRNDGDWVFTDVTAESGLGDPGHSLSTAWADCNADGLLDVYVSNRTNTLGDLTENGFYENLGDGTFGEKAAAVGIQRAGDPTLVAAFFDYDFDTAPDLYLGTDKGSGPNFTNHLFRNLGNAFMDVTTQTGAEANVDCMGIAVGDVDRNGRTDIFVTNVPHGHVLLTGNGDGTFTDSSDEAGIREYEVGWGAVFFDVDKDGREDLYICQANAANAFYYNTGQFPMLESAQSMGIATTGTSYCVSTADIDGDGDLDLLVGQQGERARLYINGNETNGNAWAAFDVVGQGMNTFAVGAVVSVRMDGDAMIQRREVRAGHHYKAQDPTTVLFGMKDAVTLDRVTADWPNNGGRRVLYDYKANTRWTLYPPERIGDIDLDGDVDQDDRAALLARHVDANGRLTEPVRRGTEMIDADGDADFDGDDILMIGSPCTGDLASPVGVLDLADVNAFVSGFTTQQGGADMDGNGVYDLADIAAFVAGFTGGCG